MRQKKNDEKFREEIDSLSSKRNGFTEDKKRLQFSVVNLRRDHEKQNRAYQQYVQDQKIAKQEKRKQEHAEKVKAAAAVQETQVVEPEIRTLEPVIPYEQELRSIDELSKYLSRLLPSQETKTDQKENDKAAEIAEQRNKKSKENREVAVLVHKKKGQKELFDWSGMGAETKPSQPQVEKKIKVKKAKESKLTHAHAVFENFAKLQIKPPLSLAEVAPALEELKKKKRSLY